MPVVVAFELDASALREYLLPENIADAAMYVLSADGTPLFSVGNAVALSPSPSMRIRRRFKANIGFYAA